MAGATVTPKILRDSPGRLGARNPAGRNLPRGTIATLGGSAPSARASYAECAAAPRRSGYVLPDVSSVSLVAPRHLCRGLIPPLAYPGGQVASVPSGSIHSAWNAGPTGDVPAATVPSGAAWMYSSSPQ